MKLTTEHRQTLTLVVATWVLSAILYLIPYSLFGDPSPYVAISVINICVLGALFSGGVYWTVRRTRHRNMVIRLVAMILSAFAASAVLAVIDALTAQWVDLFLDPPMRPAPFALRATNNFVALVWQFALLGAAFTVIETNTLARAREVDLAIARETASRAEAAASAASLAALRYQLNPHFLFNTLNAISSLIVTRDYDAADAMLAKLSEFLRATLTSQPDALIPLEDELATLQHYLEIESVRFGDRLALEFDCPTGLNRALVPGFLLQPLVENAIKYALAPSAEPVLIRVVADARDNMLTVSVEDDGGPANLEPIAGTGVGLANIRRRLETLFGDAAGLEASRRERGFVARVRLPLAWRNGDLTA